MVKLGSTGLACIIHFYCSEFAAQILVTSVVEARRPGVGGQQEFLGSFLSPIIARLRER